MTKQPEALRLADESDNDEWIAGTKQWQEEAAKELRRLHEEVKCEERRFNDLWDQFAALDKVNQDLLEALKCIVDVNPRLWDADVRDQFEPWAKNRARAAIAKAEVKHD